MIKLIKREFKLFFSDTTLVSVFFAAPIIYGLLVGFVYKKGKTENLPIIVVDQDNTPMSSQLVDMLSESEKLQIVKMKYENNFTDQDLIQENAVIAIIIPDRFEADILQKKYPEVNTYVNTTNLLTANLASSAVQVTLGSFSAGIEISGLKKKGMSEAQAVTQYEPFKANYIRLFNPTANYFTYMFPGMIMVVFQQILLLGLAISFGREFENKTFASQMVSQTGSALKMMLVKVIPFWIFSVFIFALFYGFHAFFNAPMPYAFKPFAINTVCFTLSVSMLGLFFSILFKNSLKATQILMLIASPAFIMGGYSWPVSAMPTAIQYITQAIPLTPFLEGHKRMLFQKASLSDISPSVESLLIQALVYGILAFILIQLQIRKAKKEMAS